MHLSFERIKVVPHDRQMCVVSIFVRRRILQCTRDTEIMEITHYQTKEKICLEQKKCSRGFFQDKTMTKTIGNETCALC